MRAELVGIFLVLFAVVVAGMGLGWRNRGRRQAELAPLPVAPDGLASDGLAPGGLGPDLAPPIAGLYVGTTTAFAWQDRVVVNGLGQRAAAVARLTPAGVLITRQGASSIFLPAGQVLDARLEPALAGKVVGAGGLLVLRWQHGAAELDTGLRGDDKTLYPEWVRLLTASQAAQ